MYCAQTNVFFCIFDAKIGMSANLSVSQILKGGQLPKEGWRSSALSRSSGERAPAPNPHAATPLARFPGHLHRDSHRRSWLEGSSCSLAVLAPRHVGCIDQHCEVSPRTGTHSFSNQRELKGPLTARGSTHCPRASVGAGGVPSERQRMVLPVTHNTDPSGKSLPRTVS